MGQPLWPNGIVGSITHASGMVLVAVTDAQNYRSVGLDVEPNEPLPPDVVDHICLSGESDAAPVSRAVFVVKEAFYKAHCEVHHRMLDFTDVRVQWNRDRWTATEIIPPPGTIGSTTLEGYLVVTAEWLAAFCTIEA
jgi:4'-phosphopantetheinyl transferase EntD